MGWLKRFSLKAKLMGLCIFFLFFTVAIGLTSRVQLGTVVTDYGKIVSLSIPKMKATLRMFLSYRQIRIDLQTLGLVGVPKAAADMSAAHAVETIAEYESFDKELVSYEKAEGQQEMYDKVSAAWVDFKGSAEKVLALYKSGRSDDKEKLQDILLVESPPKAKAFREAAYGLVDYFQKTLEARENLAESAAHKSNTVITALMGIVLFFGLLIGWVFSTAISKGIGQIIYRLTENGTSVSSAATQIASSSQELSQATTEQAASLQETAASIEEMSSMVTKNTDNAKRTAENSMESQQKATEGQTAVEKMMESMNEINTSNQSIMEQVNESNKQMTEIVKVIQEIGNKTKVINDIVFQTKLLSFNASVEAARAGEHGKGFAVVAEEVGNLAQMSGNAAKEISDMLDGSIRKVEGIVVQSKSQIETLIAQGKEKVSSGVEVARQCGDLLNSIVSNVSTVSTMAGEISTASEEQSRGVTEINKAVAQLDSVTQQNAAATEQTANAAENLSTQANLMAAAVAELSQVIHGASYKEGRVSPKSSSRSEKGTVVHLDTRKKKNKIDRPKQHSSPITKVAVGSNITPSHNDPGFGEG